MEKYKKYYGAVIAAAVAVIIISAVCVNFFVDKDKTDPNSIGYSDSVKENQPDDKKENEGGNTVQTENEKSVSATLTDKNGEGEITLDMSYDKVKAALDKANVTYKAEDMYIDASDGTTYLFWTNGSEKCVDTIILTSTKEGLKVGDTESKMEEIYGAGTSGENDGEEYRCYVSGKVQLTVSFTNENVSGISLSSVKLSGSSDSEYETDNLFSGEYTVEIASDNSHQRAVKYTAETGTRDCFVQIAESQVGYVNGYINGENIAFPYAQNNGWSKYGSSAGSPISPWCAWFISWCADRAGIDEDLFERSATADINWQDFTNNESYIPKIGDLVYFKYNVPGNPVSYANHVGIIVDYDASTKTIITVEGDVKGGQCVKKAYRLNDSSNEITGFSSIGF